MTVSNTKTARSFLTRFGLGGGLTLATTVAAMASCPIAADMDGEGVRFVGADGYDVVHRRLDAERVEARYFEAAAPNDWSSRSILIHGVHVQWFGNYDATGRLEDGSATILAREIPVSDLPVPVPGLNWQGEHVFQQTGEAPLSEVTNLSVRGPTEWQLGACTFEALMVIAANTSEDGYQYTETMMYVPELRTAVLVDFTDNESNSPYTYIAVRAEGQPAASGAPEPQPEDDIQSLLPPTEEEEEETK
jgi:hypothetical protein